MSYLVLDLIGRIRHKDSRGVDRGTHLGTRTLKGREELGVDQARLRVFQTLGHITRQTEVRVLVNSARNKARNILLAAKYMRERVGEGRGGLDSNKMQFTDGIPIVPGQCPLIPVHSK